MAQTCKIFDSFYFHEIFLFKFWFLILQIDSFVLDEQEEETGELSEDEDSRLEDIEDDLDEEDLEDSEDLDEDEDEDVEDEIEDEDLDLGHHLVAAGNPADQRFLLRPAGAAGASADGEPASLPAGAALAAAAELDAAAVAAASAAAAAQANPGDIYPSVDPETQAKLEALFETAGIGKLSGETKQFTDPEVKFWPLFDKQSNIQFITRKHPALIFKGPLSLLKMNYFV